MAKASKKTLLERWARIEPGLSLWQWGYDRVANNWQWVVAFFGSGGMTYLAAVTEWMNPWGPVGWGAVGVATFVALVLVLSLGYSVYSRAQERIAYAEFAKRSADNSNVNVLATTHNHERIQLLDFYHPYYQTTKNVRFEDCELHGPANIFLRGGLMVDSTFADCEIIIKRNDRIMRGIIAFENCNILRCHIYRATLVMDINHYNGLPQDVRDNLPVVSDGRIGDI